MTKSEKNDPEYVYWCCVHICAKRYKKFTPDDKYEDLVHSMYLYILDFHQRNAKVPLYDCFCKEWRHAAQAFFRTERKLAKEIGVDFND